VILLILSLLSWAIMILKWIEFKRMGHASRAMWRELEHVSRLDELRALQKRALPSPFSRILTRALTFLDMMRSSRSPAPAGFGADPVGGAGSLHTAPLSGSQVEALRLVLDAETVEERGRLGRYIPTLAVVGSASPLLGLLGTVIGVIAAFLGIATQGSGNLSAVAPGVAEALIATAAALSVAIPAVFGYNIFASRLNRIDDELESFGTEIIALLVREGQI
jgi:biopolymer transport protein TolQ